MPASTTWSRPAARSSRSAASVGSSVAAAPERVDPAEPDLRLGLGLGAPQRRVLLGQQAGHAGRRSAAPGLGGARHGRRAADGQPGRRLDLAVTLRRSPQPARL